MRESTSLHAIGYTRVSTAEQAEHGHSLDAQRVAIQDRAAREGWAVEWASDPGCSGKYINPSLANALEKLSGGRADALVVTKLDRLARSVAHAADILETAQAQGWNLIVLDLGIDLTTPQGRALAQMLAVFAELEREMISRRIKDGMAQRRRDGKPLGRRRLASTAVVKRICDEREAGVLPHHRSQHERGRCAKPGGTADVAALDRPTHLPSRDEGGGVVSARRAPREAAPWRRGLGPTRRRSHRAPWAGLDGRSVQRAGPGDPQRETHARRADRGPPVRPRSHARGDVTEADLQRRAVADAHLQRQAPRPVRHPANVRALPDGRWLAKVTAEHRQYRRKFHTRAEAEAFVQSVREGAT